MGVGGIKNASVLLLLAVVFGSVRPAPAIPAFARKRAISQDGRCL